MKKLFSLLTLALLTMSAWAATTVTLDFTSNDEWNLPTAYTVEQNSYTNGDGYTVTLEGTTGNGYKYGGGYLILGKSGAYLSLPAFQYPVSKIEVVGKSGASSSVVQNIYVGENEVSTATTGATGTNTYEIADAYQAAGNIYTLKVTSNHNTQITKINITLEDGSAPVETVAAPVFTPNGGKFSENSLEVTVSCADGPCDIYVFEGNEVDWTGTYFYYNGPFYVTETKTYTAIAYKGSAESAPTTVTFTKVDPAPAYTFLPAEYDAVENKAFSIEKDGVTFACTQGTITGDQFRIFKNQTATFTTGEGVADIVKIEFTCTAEDNAKYGPGCFAMQGENGAYTYEGYIGTWTGKTNSVAFKAITDQVRATQIVFTLDDGTTAYVIAPTLPESCEFENSKTIEIINNEEGSTIMYALNDGDYTEYSVPFTINQTTTVKAYAEYEGIRSNVVSATYTLVESPDITTLAQVNGLNDGDDFEFKGDAVVTYQYGQYLFVRDNSDYGLIYGTVNSNDSTNLNPTFEAGTVLNQNWTAKKTTYNSLVEYTGAQNVSASGNTNAELAAPQAITALSEDMVNALVTISNVTSISGTTATLADGTEITLYNRFNATIPSFTDGNNTITGIVSIYKSNLQLYFISCDYVAPQPTVVDVNNIAEAIALDEGTQFTMYNDVVVTYHNGKRLFIRDTKGNSGMIYDTNSAIEGTFENGQVLSDGWTATYQYFNGNTPEFTNPEGVEAAGTETRDASPFKRESIDSTNVNEYVILKGVTLQADTTDTNIFYTANGVQICNFFSGVEIPAVEEGKTYDVTGIVILSKAGLARVYITELTEAAAAGLRGDVNNDGDVNIGDVTTLIDYLLNPATEINAANADCTLEGDINIGDVTALIDYLLSNAWPE